MRIPNKDHRVDVFFTVFVDPNLQVFSLSLSSPKHMLEEPGRDSAPMSDYMLGGKSEGKQREANNSRSSTDSRALVNHVSNPQNSFKYPEGLGI